MQGTFKHPQKDIGKHDFYKKIKINEKDDRKRKVGSVKSKLRIEMTEFLLET